MPQIRLLSGAAVDVELSGVRNIGEVRLRLAPFLQWPAKYLVLSSCSSALLSDDATLDGLDEILVVLEGSGFYHSVSDDTYWHKGREVVKVCKNFRKGGSEGSAQDVGAYSICYADGGREYDEDAREKAEACNFRICVKFILFFKDGETRRANKLEWEPPNERNRHRAVERWRQRRFGQVKEAKSFDRWTAHHLERWMIAWKARRRRWDCLARARR
eukprot:TRINITY_DN52596_c0_g1_i1.p1 TRINITY_DN52596_c0_g1~~TRINITY_DN52596_c0_g1_i1.p1  ORF type:complete len:216 (+),score=36.52 TRINITY_DN52596_c0_g1_i1:106-753(+)